MAINYKICNVFQLIFPFLYNQQADRGSIYCIINYYHSIKFYISLSNDQMELLRHNLCWCTIKLIWRHLLRIPQAIHFHSDCTTCDIYYTNFLKHLTWPLSCPLPIHTQQSSKNITTIILHSEGNNFHDICDIFIAGLQIRLAIWTKGNVQNNTLLQSIISHNTFDWPSLQFNLKWPIPTTRNTFIILFQSFEIPGKR